MTSSPACCSAYSSHELRFQPIADGIQPMAFPCDVAGNVDMNSLARQMLENYLYARAVVGREFARPRVIPRCPA